MTQHGLAGMKTPGTRQGGRQVQDKTYWQGQIRSKMTEISTEIEKLEQEMKNQEEEAESFLSYKRMAAQNAKELQELQSRLQDSNTVLEKHNQGLDDQDIEEDILNLQQNNENEEESLNSLFNVRQEREVELKQVEKVKLHIHPLFSDRIPTVKLKIRGKTFLKSESRTLLIFFTFFHGSGLAKSQPLPLVDS